MEPLHNDTLPPDIAEPWIYKFGPTLLFVILGTSAVVYLFWAIRRSMQDK